MSDQTAQAGNGQPQQPPQLNIIGQYIKDLSFENPGAPDSLRTKDGKPNIGIQVNVSARQMGDTDYEVDLKIDAKGESGDTVLFNTELLYSGLFRIANVPQEALQAVIMIECPRLLFPFARQIISDVTQRGGFPPLMIDPVDFAALYRQRVEQARQQASTQPTQ